MRGQEDHCVVMVANIFGGYCILTLYLFSTLANVWSADSLSLFS